jgi:hypothetical protein
MNWLDPERLKALYGMTPPAPEGEGVTPPSDKKAKKQEKKEKKALKKAAKKAQKKLDKQARKEREAHSGIPQSKLDKCCKKFRKGKQCRDCPLGEKARLLLPPQ